MRTMLLKFVVAAVSSPAVMFALTVAAEAGRSGS